MGRNGYGVTGYWVGDGGWAYGVTEQPWGFLVMEQHGAAWLATVSCRGCTAERDSWSAQRRQI